MTLWTGMHGRTVALTLLLAVGCSVAASGCGGGVEAPKPAGTGGSASGSGGGPATGSGGNAVAGTGGASATSTGGASVTSTGGRPANTGGAPGSGGATAGATGGSTASGGGPGGVVLTLPWMDDFEAAGVGTIPTRWLADPADTVGKWAVAMDGATKVLQESVNVTAASWIVGGDRNWSDQKVEARVKFAAVTSSALALVAARFVSLDNYYFLNLRGDGTLKIRKRIMNGMSTSTLDVLSYKSGAALTAGTWYTVAIEIKGNTLTAYLNGTAVGTMTEPAISLDRGGIALGFQDAAGSFDDVKVTLP